MRPQLCIRCGKSLTRCSIHIPDLNVVGEVQLLEVAVIDYKYNWDPIQTKFLSHTRSIAPTFICSRKEMSHVRNIVFVKSLMRAAAQKELIKVWLVYHRHLTCVWLPHIPTPNPTSMSLNEKTPRFDRSSVCDKYQWWLKNRRMARKVIGNNNVSRILLVKNITNIQTLRANGW